MATASCSAPSVSSGHLTTPEYRNWLALGHALTTVLCQGLRPFINRETETFYKKVTAAIAALPAAGPCTCVYDPKRKKNQYHDMSTCVWANILQAHHFANRPNWKQSDSAKWLDPNLGPWEIAKLFLPDLGGHTVIMSAEDMDITGILNLLYWCDQFTIPRPLIKDVRETRNSKWVHVPKLELTNVDKANAFSDIENLLQDPQLAGDPDAQKALREIVNLKSITDLHSMEAQVLADFKEAMNDLAQEAERNKDEVSQLKEAIEEVLEQRSKLFGLFFVMWELLVSLIGNIGRSVRGCRKDLLLMWMMLLLFWSWSDVSNDDTFLRDGTLNVWVANNLTNTGRSRSPLMTLNDIVFFSLGCAIKEYDDLWRIKYFDFSEFITSSNSDFLGRRWLYQDMEEIMVQTERRGVLLIGNPGSGKTAFVCHLLCSRTSSPFIHDRIIGYHFCMHSDKGTQNAAKFVRNLANMVAWSIAEYRDIISSDSFVHRVLQNNCPQDPEWCFQEGIITPLKKLQHQPKQPWYVIIDALDECAADKAEILSMLKSKVRRLPRWMKLIITSRNMSTITTSLEGMHMLELRSDDARNLEDIDRYSSHKIYPLKGSIISRIKEYFSIRDNNTPTQRIVSSLVEKSQGNFLFVRLVLNFLLASTDNVNWTENFPKTLDNIFQLYFERKFSTRESFQSLREIFEVLVASYTPLSAQVIHSLLKLDNPALDFEYDVMPKLEEVSLFLWYGSENGLVRIYHASLSEWLTSETNKGRFYYVKRRNGHKRLAKYYLQHAKSIKKPLTPEEAFHLTCHIVEGGSNEHQVHEFLSLLSNLVNSSDEFNTTALHISSRTATSEVTKLLAKHFCDVDCLDNDLRTPAFVAATAGRLKNLIILFERGANLNYTVTCSDVKLSINSLTKDPVREWRRRACEYSLLHIAAQEGNVDIVEFLIKHQVNVMKTTGCDNTAIQLAARNGHLEVVETLKKAGGVLDGICLHYAADGGHSCVVDYLLNEGVRDYCVNDSTLMKLNAAKKNWKDIRVHMHDNYHLKMRETALHAAVKKGHPSVIESLLRQRESAVNCLNAAGRRPIHEAVHSNSYNTLKVMLEAGVNTSVRCNASMPFSGTFPRLLMLGGLQHHYCPCGFTPLHIAAMHGYHSVTKLLVAHNADVNARDCNGSTPLHIASCHGMVSLVTLLVHSGARINRRSFNFSTPLHSAAACFATSSFCTLLDLGSNFFARDDKNMTALHYFVKGIEDVGMEYFADLYVDKPINWIEEASNKTEPWEKGDLQYSWLNALIRITNSFSFSIDPTQFAHLSVSIFKTYSSVFQLLEQKANASSLLTGSGSFDRSYVVSMATSDVFVRDIIVHNVLKSVVLTINRPYETTFIPDPLKKALSRTFAVLYPGVLNCSLLTYLMKVNLARSANVVLQAGADVNCQDQSGSSPLLTYLHRGGRHMSKVLTKHKVKVDILCGDPFERSTMHLMSYHKLHYLHYLSQYILGEKQWSKYLALDNALFDYFLYNVDEIREDNGSSRAIWTGDGPLALAIKSHPQGTEVINECFDADGFNALHRAAQGANVIAIETFLAWGANPHLENADDFSPLWLSVLYSVKYTPFLNFHVKNILTALEVDLASMSASRILNHLLQNGTVHIGCNESRPDLTLYHIAAIRGMWPFIYHLLSNKKLTGLDVNCPNKDGITPMYLAKLVGGVACNSKNPWCKVVEVIEIYGGKLRYPTLEAEYFLFFHLFFGMSPGHMFLELEEHEVCTLQQDCGRDECQGYKNGDADLYNTSFELDRVFLDYSEIVVQCHPNLYSEGCLPEIHQDWNHFQSIIHAFHEYQSLKLQHTINRYDFVSFLEEESILIQLGLLDVTRPYSRMLRKPKTNEENQHHRTTTNNYDEGNQRSVPTDGGPDDMCSNDVSLVTALRRSYLSFKESFDKLQGHSKQTKSVIFAKRNLPPVLWKVNHALHRYYLTLRCDWQAITAKYVMLRFQIWNLKLVTQYVNENSRVVSISDFASLRMKKVFIEPSEDSLKLVLRLANEESSEIFDDLDYLTILKFRKPPLWKGTFDAW